MAELKIISSGSKGNGYIIETKSEKLLLELGVSWNKILGCLDYDISNVVGALVSHRHSDHAISLNKAISYRIPVFSCKDVWEVNNNVVVLDANKKYKIGNFRVQPIPVEHNVENYAYLIEHDEIGRLLFFTDCTSFPYGIKNLNHILAEANYSLDIALNKAIDGEEIRSHNEYHCEIESTLETLEMLNNPNLNNIVLIHLSDGQSDEKLFKQKVFDVTGIEPYIADKDQIIEINKEEF